MSHSHCCHTATNLYDFRVNTYSECSYGMCTQPTYTCGVHFLANHCSLLLRTSFHQGVSLQCSEEVSQTALVSPGSLHIPQGNPPLTSPLCWLVTRKTIESELQTKPNAQCTQEHCIICVTYKYVARLPYKACNRLHYMRR